MDRNKRTITIKTIDEKKRDAISFYAAVAVMFLIICVALFAAVKLGAKKEEEPPITEEDMMDRYVGPADVKDRGEWMPPVEYYAFYEDDAKEVDVAGTLFAKEGSMKGIVPAGVRLEPVIMTYDDFEPFESQGDLGYMESYYVTAEPREAEIQLGVRSDMNLTGSYITIQNGMMYMGDASVSLNRMEYYMEQTFDVNGNYDGEPDGGYYGFINPHFDFDYDLNGSASIGKDYGQETGELTFKGKGKLSDGSWQYTSNLSGQGNDIFRQGEIYIRCKLPCKVRRKQDGKTSDYDGNVNIYFRVNEVRIGTREDCMPETSTFDNSVDESVESETVQAEE